MSDEYVGMCIQCHLPIYVDEGYRIVKKMGPFSKYICEGCLHTCPICDTVYETEERAKDCFRGCSGMNH